MAGMECMDRSHSAVNTPAPSCLCKEYPQTCGSTYWGVTGQLCSYTFPFHLIILSSPQNSPLLSGELGVRIFFCFNLITDHVILSGRRMSNTLLCLLWSSECLHNLQANLVYASHCLTESLKGDTKVTGWSATTPCNADVTYLFMYNKHQWFRPACKLASEGRDFLGIIIFLYNDFLFKKLMFKFSLWFLFSITSRQGKALTTPVL